MVQKSLLAAQLEEYVSQSILLILKSPKKQTLLKVVMADLKNGIHSI